MAEVGIVASIIGIAGAGARLSMELYDFGATVTSARREANSIARSVSNYSRTMKILGVRLKDERPIHSPDALLLVKDIKKQSVSILGQIRSMIPEPSSDNSMSFKKRIKWTFRKTKVEFLLGRLDAEKATLTLLVQILYTGSIIRNSREPGNVTEEAKTEIHAECVQAQVLVVERQAATDLLPELQKAAEAEENELLLTMPEEQTDASDLVASSTTDLILRQEQTLLGLDSALPNCSAAETQGLIIRQSDNWCQYLLQSWTTLSNAFDQDHGAQTSTEASQKPGYVSTESSITATDWASDYGSTSSELTADDKGSNSDRDTRGMDPGGRGRPRSGWADSEDDGWGTRDAAGKEMDQGSRHPVSSKANIRKMPPLPPQVVPERRSDPPSDRTSTKYASTGGEKTRLSGAHKGVPPMKAGVSAAGDRFRPRTGDTQVPLGYRGAEPLSFDPINKFSFNNSYYPSELGIPGRSKSRKYANNPDREAAQRAGSSTTTSLPTQVHSEPQRAQYEIDPPRGTSGSLGASGLEQMRREAKESRKERRTENGQSRHTATVESEEDESEFLSNGSRPPDVGASKSNEWRPLKRTLSKRGDDKLILTHQGREEYLYFPMHSISDGKLHGVDVLEKTDQLFRGQVFDELRYKGRRIATDTTLKKQGLRHKSRITGVAQDIPVWTCPDCAGSDCTRCAGRGEFNSFYSPRIIR